MRKQIRNYWITTDTHFSHEKQIEFGRPVGFENLIKDALQEKVKPKDVLIHLGDVCIGDDVANNNWFKDNLKCRTWLVKGNHDHKSIGWYLDNGWDAITWRLDLHLFGKRICFTHIPIKMDGTFDVNIHGHFHNNDHRKKETKFTDILTKNHLLIALEEVKYQPVNLNSLLSKHYGC